MIESKVKAWKIVRENLEGLMYRVKLRAEHMKKRYANQKEGIKPTQKKDMKLPEAPTITPAQARYLTNLCDDAGFKSRIERNAFFSLRVNREIKYMDQLTRLEASAIIDEIKQLIEDKK